MTKKLTILISLLIFVSVITACSNNTSSGNQDAAQSNNNDEEERFTVTIMANLLAPQTPNDYLLEMLQDATNTNLDIQWVPDGNFEERLNTAFATNTMPHVIKMNQNMYNQFKDAIRADQFWEIEPYLGQFENLSKLKPEILDNTRVDGKLYALYQGRPLSRQGVIYRKDWADNLGLDAPTTTEEFFEMVRAFTVDDPNGTGQDDTIGLTDRSDLIYGAFKTVSSWFGTPNNWGLKDDQILPEFMFDEYIQTMDFFKEMHSNGYMNQDFPVTSSNDQQAMIKNGTAGVYVGAMVGVQSFYNEAKELNPDIKYDVQNVIKGPQGEYATWAIPGYGALFLFPKSVIEEEEELLKILSFFDHLMEPDNMNLLMWGVEGEHYEIVDGGVQVMEENLAKIESEVRPFLSLEIGEPETSGRYEPLATYETKAKADELVKDNDNYLIHDPTIVLDSETFVTHGDRLQKLIDDATFRYILGQIDLDGFNEATERWKNEGGNDMIEEFTASYYSVN
jgi:putative aldouronate transport system substrate-binding protein